MTRALCTLLLVVACQKAGAPRHEEPMSPTPTDGGASASADAGPSADELRGKLRLALTPHGNRPDLASRDQAIAWLLAHADAAFPVVLAEAQASPSPALLGLLARFDRPEATPVLVAALGSAEPAEAEAAARALGASRDPAAQAAALEATRHADPEVVAAAIDGLRVRGDRGACPTIVAATTHASPEVRYVAVEAGAALGCLDAGQLTKLATSDPDPDVRARAGELARGP